MPFPSLHVMQASWLDEVNFLASPGQDLPSVEAHCQHWIARLRGRRVEISTSSGTLNLTIVLSVASPFSRDLGTLSSPHHTTRLVPTNGDRGVKECPPVYQHLSRHPRIALGFSNVAPTCRRETKLPSLSWENLTKTTSRLVITLFQPPRRLTRRKVGSVFDYFQCRSPSVIQDDVVPGGVDVLSVSELARSRRKVSSAAPLSLLHDLPPPMSGPTHWSDVQISVKILA